MSHTPTLWSSLLPLRGIIVTLEFLQPARFRLFHHAAVTAFLRNLLDSPADYPNLLVIDVPESGHTHYSDGDHYCFTIIALRGGEVLLQLALERLRRLPFSARRHESWQPMRDNLRLLRVTDLFGADRISNAVDCLPYNEESLLRESALWSTLAERKLTWRWLTPARISRPPDPDQPRRKGRFPFCRESEDISGDLLLRRCHDAIIGLVARRSGNRPPRPPVPAIEIRDAITFWVDNHYTQPHGRRRKMGGLSGVMTLILPEEIDEIHWQALTLGQYLGVGENRAFGLGRYRLETAEGEITAHRAQSMASLIDSAASWDNLVEAFRVVRERAGDRREIPRLGTARTTTILQRIGEQLRSGAYRPATLQIVLSEKNDGGPRVLSIPPWEDRVAQRAVSQILTPALNDVFYPDSHGYRRGHGRQSARDAVRKAWIEGFRWVFESDIADFFPSVRWEHLAARLHALYGDDPVRQLIMDWMKAPMEYQGRPLRRERGLPQGSSLSPLLANLMLDDFDRDMEAAGFRMIRFADDFVVLCKNPERAAEAREAVEASLDDLDFDLKERKTAIRHFKQGFRYLGYLFMNDMIIDVGGKRGAARQPRSMGLPPEWLAMLADHPVSPLDEDEARRGLLPVSVESLPATQPEKSGHAGKSATDEGMLVIVTGASSLLVTYKHHLKVKRDQQTIVDQPWSAIYSILLLGPHHITTPAIRAALRASVPVHLASTTGKYQGVVWNPKSATQGSQLWLVQQQHFAEAEAALRIARSLVEARIRHMREVLRQSGHDGGDAIKGMKRLLAQLPGAPDLAALNGLEGNATKQYFHELQTIIPEEWGFHGRRRRPPPDPFNALLSLGYTMLYSITDSLLRVDGLLPAVGCYHQGGGTHAALASDMMEPFRHLVERTAIGVLLRHQLTADDFEKRDITGSRLTTTGLRRYLNLLHQRFELPLRTLDDDQARPMTMHLHRQNLVLIDAIRGKAPFRAFLVR